MKRSHAKTFLILFALLFATYTATLLPTLYLRACLAGEILTIGSILLLSLAAITLLIALAAAIIASVRAKSQPRLKTFLLVFPVLTLLVRCR